MDGLKCSYALSFDSIRGEENITYEVPKQLYDRHVYMKSGKSSFSRICASKDNVSVMESLYLKNFEE